MTRKTVKLLEALRSVLEDTSILEWKKTSDGYEADFDGHKAKLYKQGKKWVMDYRGQTVDFPKNKASFDHAEGMVLDINAKGGSKTQSGGKSYEKKGLQWTKKSGNASAAAPKGKGRGFPVGTKRKRKDGYTYEKRQSGRWTRVR